MNCPTCGRKIKWAVKNGLFAAWCGKHGIVKPK